MGIEIIRRQESSFGWRIFTFMFLVALIGFASVAGATYSLPAARSVTWQGNVGVSGDIPTRTTIYTTLFPSGGDDTSAIQTAINNCPAGQVVKLNAGTFKVSSPITVKSGITLRGAGMGTTAIQGVSGMSGSYVIGINAGYSTGSSVSLSAGFGKGSTTITTSSSHGWSVGDIIVIDQLNNASADPPVTNVGNNGTCTWCGRSSGTRSLGQVVKIVAVPASTTATLEIPLYWNYDTSLSPQGTKLNGRATNAGIEDLTVDNSLSGGANQSGDGGTIIFYGTTNCWLLRVEAIGAYTNMVMTKGAYRNTFRSCKIHEGTPATPINGSQYNSGRAYGFRFGDYNSANLLENSQMYHLYMAFVANGAMSGNVIAYNYATTLYSPATSWNVEAFDFHGGHPMMNLIEGNFVSAGRFVADDVWGSSSHNTYFRNRHSLSPGVTGAAWDFDLQRNAQYFNIIGNVLGSVETVYEFNNGSLSGAGAIYRLGYTADNDTDASGNDSQVFGTLLRHANWDSVNNGVVWNGSDDRVLPPSFYLSSKPAWWNNLPWPAIGPDVSPMYPAAPGAGNGTPWGNSKSITPPLLNPPQ